MQLAQLLWQVSQLVLAARELLEVPEPADLTRDRL